MTSPDEMSLLNGGKGRDNGYDDHWHDRFQKHGQWNSDEKQKTGRLVGDGVREEKSLVHHYCGNLVDDFDDEDCRKVLAVGGEKDELDSPLLLIHFLQFGQDDGIGGCCSIMKKHTIINGQVGDTLLFLHRPFI